MKSSKWSKETVQKYVKKLISKIKKVHGWKPSSDNEPQCTAKFESALNRSKTLQKSPDDDKNYSVKLFSKAERKLNCI